MIPEYTESHNLTISQFIYQHAPILSCSSFYPQNPLPLQLCQLCDACTTILMSSQKLYDAAFLWNLLFHFFLTFFLPVHNFVFPMFPAAYYHFYWYLIHEKTYKQKLSVEERRRYSRKIPSCALQL